MKLLKEFTKNEIELIENAGIIIEDKDYMQEELLSCEEEIIVLKMGI